MTEFIDQLDTWITTARNWKGATQGPVINIALTEVQEAQVDTVIQTLQGVKKMYSELIADD